MTKTDTVIPFLFESLPVRGALVQLKTSWQRMQVGHRYERPVLDILGHAAAASVLIANNLKFDGHITLQISGEGPLSMLVMQATDGLAVRGLARAVDGGKNLSYAELTAGAHCAITVGGKDVERPYQGIVAVNGESLATSLEHYYDKSAQIPTHLMLIAEPTLAGGLLLQQMPGAEVPSNDDWHRLGLLAQTLRPDDLADGIGIELLGKLFAEDDVRVYEPRDVIFQCRCSQQRTEDVLKMLGQEEAEAALNEEGKLDVTCEYCGRTRSFDGVDIKRLFAAPAGQSSSRVH